MDLVGFDACLMATVDTANVFSDIASYMVDLKDLAEQNLELLPDTAQTVLDTLEACVVYHVNGVYRSKSGGLSCYHSFNGDLEDFQLYSEVGASEGLDDNGMSDRNLIQLKAGDEITTLHYAMTISGDDDEFQMVEVDTFTVTEDTSFGETDMGDGTFLMYFELVDARNSDLTSQSILFTVEDGEITVETL